MNHEKNTLQNTNICFCIRNCAYHLDFQIVNAKLTCAQAAYLGDFRASGLRFRVYYYLSLARENLIIPRRVKSHGCSRVPRLTSAPAYVHAPPRLRSWVQALTRAQGVAC